MKRSFDVFGKMKKDAKSPSSSKNKEELSVGLIDFIDNFYDYNHHWSVCRYTTAENYAKKSRHNVKDLEDFCHHLSLMEDFANEEQTFAVDAGTYISFAANMIMTPDKEINLDLTEFKNPLWYLGMIMEGGTLNIKGDCSFGLGAWMRDGKITIDGDAGSHVGMQMTEGTIHMKGDYNQNLEHIMHHGKIIHKDMVVWEKHKYRGGY